MTKFIYLISGLGADERIFQHLDFGELTPKFIKWIEPNIDETIDNYALRLSAQIDTLKPIILGVSFGGMIAVEMAKQIDYQHIILISSAQTRQDIPLIYRIFGQLNGYKLIPIKLFKYPNFLTYWFFGMQTKAEKQLLKNILNDTDSVFLKWAINAIVRWKNEQKVGRLTHFHGESDRILPLRNGHKTDLIVPKGGHLMVFNNAKMISEALKVIQQFPLWEFHCSLRSQKGGEVVRFSGFAQKTNHILPFFYERSEQKKPKRKLLAFDKEEMEIIDSQYLMSDLESMMYNVTHYVLDSDVTLNHGETIGISAEQKLKITLSKGKFVEGKTLKIDY